MARQRPTRAPHFDIDRIVLREIQYQFEVNWCRNEEIIVKGNFGWAWLMWAGRTRIDRIVIREVQYQILIKGNFGWAWPMWPGRPRIDLSVIREVQYQFEVNRCRNEEIIVKGNLGGRGLCGRGAPGLVMGPCIYQFEVNRCRNEEIIVKGNFGWAGPMWPGGPRIALSVIREAQYQFEVNRCRNEEVE
ncbi:hypothetical protein DPMN_065606 [Dreissena polymorpha]|uniref:Uncharacterized protein n=1 Tax=Dreissena polymorpha TaxID=45954 RepID=A0A9D3YRY4_DREPO|nr:hypothetical protein DPMN_065606 [Dreissena polymorpha]